MDLELLVREARLSEEIRRHIEECDRMYCEAYGCLIEAPECNVCRRLIETGFKLTADDLPQICIRQCERWRLPEKTDAVKSTFELGVAEVDEQV